MQLQAQEMVSTYIHCQIAFWRIYSRHRQRDWALVQTVLALSCPLISEITTLRWNQVDLSQGIVRLEVGETKTDEGRTVYLDDELKETFQCLWDARKTNEKLLPWVFVNQSSSDRIKRFDKAWKKACKDSGIGIRLFHDFRRTAVRNMVRSGIPERVAMMISGHKTRSVFDRYNIVNDQDLKLAAQRQQAYLDSQTGTISGTIVDFEEKARLQNES